MVTNLYQRHKAELDQVFVKKFTTEFAVFF